MALSIGRTHSVDSGGKRALSINFRARFYRSRIGANTEMTTPQQNEEKTVPLVVYVNNLRRVVGTATVRGDHVAGFVTDPEISKAVIGDVVNTFSIGWSAEGPNEVALF